MEPTPPEIGFAPPAHMPHEEPSPACARIDARIDAR